MKTQSQITLRWLTAAALLFGLTLAAPAALAQVYPGIGEWGDAPEGATAYPSLGVMGLFPTCYGGPARCA